jgi:hypothetical protein
VRTGMCSLSVFVLCKHLVPPGVTGGASCHSLVFAQPHCLPLHGYSFAVQDLISSASRRRCPLLVTRLPKTCLKAGSCPSGFFSLPFREYLVVKQS